MGEIIRDVPTREKRRKKENRPEKCDNNGIVEIVNDSVRGSSANRTETSSRHRKKKKKKLRNIMHIETL